MIGLARPLLAERTHDPYGKAPEVELVMIIALDAEGFEAWVVTEAGAIQVADVTRLRVVDRDLLFPLWTNGS